MHEALPAILWLWAGAPLLALGCITALLVVDAQWKRAREWRRATWPTRKGDGHEPPRYQERAR